MMQFIDYILNRTTMYRLVLYYLLAILVSAVVYGWVHILPYQPINILFSAVLITLVSLFVNELCVHIFAAPANTESTYITALILALLITPIAPTNLGGILLLAAASTVAIASKYLITLRKKPIFNPAALGLVAMAFLFGHAASWWAAGNLALLPVILIGGILLVRKLQRWDLVLVFFTAALFSIFLTTAVPNISLLGQVVVHTSLLFLAFIMLTEPVTTPSIAWLRIAYGIVVGILFAPAIHIGSIYSTPELALVVGNIFSAIVNPRKRVHMTLTRIERTGKSSADFLFSPRTAFAYLPGQYMEWTLPHTKTDMRGNRRYFTLASSPTEQEVRIGVKFTKNGSSFKRALLALQPGGSISALETGGTFTLPASKTQKLVFIAGGIGITPFRSMLQYLLDRREKRDIAVLYSNRTKEDIAYSSILERARTELGTPVHYVLTEEHPLPAYTYETVTPELIRKLIPDYRERIFYISGPQAMITAFREILQDLGIPKRHIKTDFFPGFV